MTGSTTSQDSSEYLRAGALARLVLDFCRIRRCHVRSMLVDPQYTRTLIAWDEAHCKRLSCYRLRARQEPDQTAVAAA